FGCGVVVVCVFGCVFVGCGFGWCWVGVGCFFVGWFFCCGLVVLVWFGGWVFLVFLGWCVVLWLCFCWGFGWLGGCLLWVVCCFLLGFCVVLLVVEQRSFGCVVLFLVLIVDWVIAWTVVD
ncbi:hypothetical protein RA268_28155, partial [Pseudomonas syringae pv. tagetis]